ncbi:hypothetical protein [Priestia koreensis]|uniref:hypothetical protein n=1 Tax=Priestia koreensis TaxID=284581 RepID=UPI00203B096D|nr:hypothetical protein [Priestia koreensis]MCM3003525.1 hypothetical protein [Priestia koreensis]
MTPNTLRSFAGGLLVAATAMSAVYFFGPQSEASNSKKEETQILSESEMKAELESKGFVVQTQTEWDQKLASTKKAPVETQAPKADEAPKEAAYRTIVNISSGMTAVDVGTQLQKAKIVPSGFKFYKEVERRGVENKLRPGTYVVQSDMTTEEIIAVIFK